MLSANSSRALAPIVSMEVMSVGSLFLVLAAVPCRQESRDENTFYSNNVIKDYFYATCSPTKDNGVQIMM